MTNRVLYPTGSAYIVGPESANDVDLLVYAGADLPELTMGLLEQGHASCTILDSDGYEDCTEDPDRRILRKGHLNTLVFSDPVAFLKWAAATELALALGLADRDSRCDLFRAIRADDQEAALRVLEARGEGMSADTAQWLLRMDRFFDGGKDS